MADSHEHEEHSHHHIVRLPIYYTVFGILMVMTALTVGVAYVNLGPLNIVVALLIAAFKASLVILFFMHVKYSSRLTQLAAAAGFVWLIILIGFTISDYISRPWVGAASGWTMQPVEEGRIPRHETRGESEADLGQPGVEAAGEQQESGGH